MVSAFSLRRLGWLAAPVKAATRSIPRLNAVSWNLQYRLGLWDYLDAEEEGRELLRAVRKYAPGGDILDLGCGTTANLPLSPGTYRRYHGVDISAKAIARARALTRPDTSFETADILSYEPRGTYDAILLREVLYYLPPAKISGFLRHLSGFLAPDGVIVIQVWAGEDNPGLAASITGCGLVSRLAQTAARAGANPRATYVLTRPGTP